MKTLAEKINAGEADPKSWCWKQPFGAWDCLSESTKSRVLCRTSKNSPFYDFVGNDSAVEAATIIASKAFQQNLVLRHCWDETITDHDKKQFCSLMGVRESGKHIGLFAARSAGKTTFVNNLRNLLSIEEDTGKVSEIIKYPYARIDCTAIPFTTKATIAEHILYEMGRAFPMRPLYLSPKTYFAPPFLLFFDEVHALPKVQQNKLLDMFERKINLLKGEDWEMDTSRIIKVIATTDPDRVIQPLLSRVMTVNLEPITEASLSIAIKREYPSIPMDIAKQIACIRPVPRQALEFAEWYVDCYGQSNNAQKALEQASRIAGLHPSGLSKLAINVLTCLWHAGSNGLSKDSLASSCGISTSQLAMILPELIGNYSRKPYVLIGSRHQITEAGVEFLEGTA